MVFLALIKCDSKVMRLLSHIDVTHVTVSNLRKRRGEKLFNGRFGMGNRIAKMLDSALSHISNKYRL